MSFMGDDIHDVEPLHDLGNEEDGNSDPESRSSDNQTCSSPTLPTADDLPFIKLESESLHLSSSSNEDTGSVGELRQGRFYGPDRQWKSYTRHERALAATFEQVCCNDLSLHLYNAHAMKARARGDRSDTPVMPWHSKRRWTQIDGSNTTPFQPPVHWTAWPLLPIDVPRSRETWGKPTTLPQEDLDLYYKAEPWKPSLMLDAELKAVFARVAKTQFRQRQRSFLAATTHPGSGRESADDTTMDISPQESSSKYPDDRSGEKDDKTRLTTFLNDSAYPQPPDLSNLRMTADEEDPLVQPSVRHLISKIDDLLHGLHKSRRGHEIAYSSKFAKRTRVRSKSRTRSQPFAQESKKHRRDVSDSLMNDKKDVYNKNQTSTDLSGHRTLGTRDWSELLGMAALVGWDPAVIDRTARRCSVIFGESMEIRSMPETAAGHIRDRIVAYAPAKVEAPTGPLQPVPMDMDAQIPQTEFPCPEHDCSRHVQPYESRWRLREHLKRKHHYSRQKTEVVVPVEKDPSTNAEPRSSEPAEHLSKRFDQGSAHTLRIGMDLAMREDSFLKPINISMGRSRDKRRRSASVKRGQGEVSKG